MLKLAVMLHAAQVVSWQNWMMPLRPSAPLQGNKTNAQGMGQWITRIPASRPAGSAWHTASTPAVPSRKSKDPLAVDLIAREGARVGDLRACEDVANRRLEA